MTIPKETLLPIAIIGIGCAITIVFLFLRFIYRLGYKEAVEDTENRGKK